MTTYEKLAQPGGPLEEHKFCTTGETRMPTVVFDIIKILCTVIDDLEARVAAQEDHDKDHLDHLQIGHTPAANHDEALEELSSNPSG